MSCKTEDGQGVNQLQRWISLSAYEIQVYTTSTEANIIIPVVVSEQQGVDVADVVNTEEENGRGKCYLSRVTG